MKEVMHVTVKHKAKAKSTNENLKELINEKLKELPNAELVSVAYLSQKYQMIAWIQYDKI